MFDKIFAWTRTHKELTDAGFWKESYTEHIYCTERWMESKLNEGGIFGTDGGTFEVTRNDDDSVDVFMKSPSGANCTEEHFEPIDISDAYDEAHKELLDSFEGESCTIPFREVVKHDDEIVHVLHLVNRYDDEDIEDGYLEIENDSWVSRPKEFDE